MDNYPQGVEVELDAAFPDDTSTGSSSVSSDTPRDFHQEAYPAYVPPNRRGHNVQPGDEFVNFKNRDPRKGPDPDKVMGAENDKYQRLKIRTNFALAKRDRDLLVPDFPGIYFHSADNTNHDHPKSHVVTQIGTRFLQRIPRPGDNILDVYGNPNACERYAFSQQEAENPKTMTALVYNFGHTDFIREVNKNGPIMGPDGDRYIYGKLRGMIEDQSIAKFNVLHMIHTLYYIDFADLNDALHAPCDKGIRTAVALIHRHEGSSGTINYGEQSYTKRRGLVKQINNSTNSSYVHPDLTPILFAEKKYWYPEQKTQWADGRYGQHNPAVGTKGFTWDLKIVNSDTWIVQLVPCVRSDDQGEGFPSDEVDYEELWDEYEEQDLVEERPVEPTGPKVIDHKMILPMSDGRFVELDICSPKLLSKLRTSAINKTRNAKLIAELVNKATHLVDPSTLFGTSQGIYCPEEKIYDHVLAALFIDMQRENTVLQACAMLEPMIQEHARSLGMGPQIFGLKYAAVVTMVKRSLGMARTVNSVLSAKDFVDATLSAAEKVLD